MTDRRTGRQGAGRGALIEVFDRFTDPARGVVALAQEEARTLGHDHVGDEHLLLGLVQVEGVAAGALESLGVGLEAARQQLEPIFGQSRQVPPAHIPFTRRAKKVLELAGREATDLGYKYVGTGHLLLGIVREGEGVAAQVLSALGAEGQRVRQQVEQLLRDPASGEQISRD